MNYSRRRPPRITIQYSTEIYNLAVKMFKKQDKKGFNISIIKKDGNYKIVHMREKSTRWIVLMDYTEIFQLVYSNFNREILKREAINYLHKEVNRRSELIFVKGRI
ncbi:hypothetical protein DTX80_17485 [Bacilli bacterium]|uniref:hypothetical protein n=1 Tax=Oceanobacillus TaxID=182709 RepID=UPI0006220825|nr:hypothetical protein WH51_14160 [Bacilli bacterium VT-13-104]PZD83264.1 hypothetical protein DEJ64_15460 [Bacilli bacterium]PZD84448.1 hypothetical protein DEJ60_14540 [Bacilli bacterium]PZD86684.1 hypothetical protein DEJ66_15190 [Bacilli bacterium]RCO04328.1 hypothetical protein DTX80_17485 [Bacilli bacterium]